MTCMQLVKMKDTASMFTYTMCRKIYNTTSDHWSMSTYIVICDFIKPRQKWLIYMISMLFGGNPEFDLLSIVPRID